MHEQDEATSHGWKKLLLYWGIGFTTLFAVGLIAGVLLLRPFLAKLPERLKASLEKEGIEISFKATEAPKGRLGFEVTEFAFSGPHLPVSGKAEGLTFSIGLVPKLKPVLVELRLTKSLLEKNETYAAKETAQEKPASLSGLTAKAIGIVAKLAQTTLIVEDLSAPQFGFNHLHYNLGLSKFGLNAAGKPSVQGAHSLRVEEVLQQPALNNLLLRGSLNADLPVVRLMKHNVSASFFSLIFDSQYNVDTQSWTLESNIPKAEVATRPLGLNSAIMEYVALKEGTLAITAKLQGEGSDFQKIKGEGSLDLDGFKAKLKHPSAEGILAATVKASFKKGETLEVQTDAEIDLNSLMVRYEKYFYKEQGVPLTLELHVKGNEKNIQIQPSKFTFHSLNSTISGDLAVNPAEPSSLNFNIEPTDLVRWERFFPKNTAVRTSGMLAAKGTFEGSVANWQTGKLSLNISAEDVQLPFMPEWNTNKETSLVGTIHVNSKTQLELDNGTIKTLGTDSQVNLGNLEVKYGSLFKKAAGAPLRADLVINSTATKAEIKKGLFEVGQIKFKAGGSINNFKNPVASLTVDSSPVSLNQLLELSPNIQPKNISKVAGTVAIKSKITGLLLSEKGPTVNGVMDVKNLSLGYEMETSKKLIQLNNLSGPVAFTNNSINAQKISFSFPKTQGTARLSVADFKAPNVQFDINASTFSVSDFYDMPKGAAIPPGAMPVPISDKSKEDDFRNNPFLKAMTVVGTAKIQKADLGYTVADQVSAQIDFRKMRLKISPFKMGVFGGTVTSETDWNGEPAVPVTKQTLKVENVDANRFLASYTEKAKDVIEGKFFTQMSVAFSGMDPEQIKKSLDGKGNFTLKEGKIKTLRLTQGPLESLKKIPQLGNSITKTDWEEKLNDATGQFTIKNGTLTLANLVLHSPYFEATAPNATIDMSQNILAKVLWTPKNNIIGGEGYEMLKDDQGKTSLPLTVSGNIMSPMIALDSSVLEDRAKGYLARRLATEKDRALQEARKKAEEEGKKAIENAVKDKVGQGIGNLFQ